jgi:Holliday junction resolvasome RuvABC endonuclease subunit
MILGIDISSSITGYTILDNNGKIVISECIRLEKYKCFFEKVVKCKQILEKINEKYEIDAIFIEEHLLSFKMGFSSASTISTLSKFNGVLSWICYEMFKTQPQYFSAATARKACGIKVPKGEKAKEFVFKTVLDTVPDFTVEWTAKGNPAPGTYDRCDSYIIAKAGFLQCGKKK